MGLCIWRPYKLTLVGNHQHSLILFHLMLFVVLGLLAQCLLISVATENVFVSLWLS